MVSEVSAFRGKGIGLRSAHYADVLRQEATVDWFEVITENLIDTEGRPLHILEKVRENFPLGLHGVALNIGSTDPLNKTYLKKLKTLIKRVEPRFVSDHLCWGGIEGRHWHDLLPLPMNEESVAHLAKRISRVQDFLGHQMAFENLSSYVRFADDRLTEWDFIRAVAEEANCLLLCDVNNIYVNSVNHRFDPVQFLQGLPAERIVQYHLAGHSDLGDFLFDTHDHAIGDPVWNLFQRALEIVGPRPFLIERDGNIPSLSEVEREAHSAGHLTEIAWRANLNVKGKETVNGIS